MQPNRNKESKEKFEKICTYLAEQIKGTELEGHVFAVGGCIRDSLLGLEIKDIDLAVDLPNGGLKLAELLKEKKALSRDFVFFEAYSVVNFVLKEFPEMELEAVQTRKEKYEDKTSRNPVTAFGSIEEDCYRRDLTINSLYKNISTGEILDITGYGIIDLQNGVIRTPLEPEDTFDDDPLRMLRVVRFAARFAYTIEKDVYDAIVKMKSRLNIVSWERTHDEFVKMLKNKNTDVAIRLLAQTGLFKQMLHQSQEWIDVDSFKDFDSLYHIRTDIIANNRYIVKLAYILFDNNIFLQPDIMAEKLKFFAKILKFSNEDRDYLIFLYKYLFMLKKGFTEALVNRMCYEIRDVNKITDIVMLYSCIEKNDCYNNKTDDQLWQGIIMNITKSRGINFFEYELPFNGEFIMEYFCIPPGPEVREIRETMLNYVFNNPDAELEDILKAYPKTK